MRGYLQLPGAFLGWKQRFRIAATIRSLETLGHQAPFAKPDYYTELKADSEQRRLKGQEAQLEGAEPHSAKTKSEQKPWIHKTNSLIFSFLFLVSKVNIVYLRRLPE